MELKFDKTAKEALAQIESNHYADAFAMSSKQVVKVGINFNGKGQEEYNRMGEGMRQKKLQVTACLHHILSALLIITIKFGTLIIMNE